MKCIIWKGPIWSQGRYGMDSIEGKSMGAHRAAWIRKYGKISKGLLVCHKCDNGLCVNTAHLFLGTPKDNMQDCKNKNRLGISNQKLSKNGNSKYDVERLISEGKRLKTLGYSYQKIADSLGLASKGHIHGLLKRHK